MPRFIHKASTSVEIAIAFFKAQEALTALPLDAPDADADALFDILQNLDVLQEKTPAKTRDDFAAKILQRRATTREDTSFVDLSDEANVKYAWAAAPAELRELFHRMELRDVLAEAGVRRQHSVGMSTPRMRRELEKLRRGPRPRVSRRRRLGAGDIETISIEPVHPRIGAAPAKAA